MCVGLNIYWETKNNNKKHLPALHKSPWDKQKKKKKIKELDGILEGTFIYFAFLSSINIIKWWLSALFLTREIEFHELLMRLIFLRKEHWSLLVSVDFSFFLVVVFWKGNACTSEKILKCEQFYNNTTTVDEGECKMTSYEPHR